MTHSNKPTETFNTDALVIGGGMAGMTVAARLAEAGRIVLVVEKAPDIGGSAVLSGGKLWTAKSLEMFAEEAPGGDPSLQRAAFEMFEPAATWLRSTSIQVAELSYHLYYGKGYDFDVVAYIDWCRSAVRNAGGWIVCDAVAKTLDTENGAVVGALVSDRDGLSEVRAPWTILATGGFPANPELLKRYIHPNADRALARSNPCSTGDGLRLGIGAGAATSTFMKGFYGHVMQSPAKSWGPREFRAYTQGASIKSLLLNTQGHRFCDESLGDHQNAQRILEQPEAKALLILDDAVRQSESRLVLAGTSSPIDKIQIAIDEGARVAVAENWVDLFQQTSEWGFDATTAMRTVAQYNAAASNDGRNLTPPRRRDLKTYDTPPFYAVEVQSGVTATHGGLCVDNKARVLDASGRPIPGLLAAGADAGNIYGEGYAGGLNFAATFGLLAADQVLAASA